MGAWRGFGVLMPTGIALSRRSRRKFTRSVIPETVGAWSASDMGLLELPTILPDDISGLTNWWKPDDLPLGLVSLWEDSVGSIDLSQATESKQPLCIPDATNGQKSVFFNGINSLLVGAPLADTSEGTVIIVAKELDANVRYYLTSADEALTTKFVYFGKHSTFPARIEQRNADTADQVYASDTNHSSAIFRRLVYLSTGTNYKLFTDGVEQTTEIIASGADTGDWLGDSPGRDNTVMGAIKNSSGEGTFLNGFICEIMVYDHALTNLEIADIDAYLVAKYKGRLLDKSGNDHHMKFGATNVIGASDEPVHLPFYDKKYVINPLGATANRPQAVYQGDMHVSGDLSIRVGAPEERPFIALTAVKTLFSRFTASGNQRSWRLGINTSRILQFQLSTDGGVGSIVGSTVPLPAVANGVWVTYRISDKRVQFWWCSDFDEELGDGTWEQLGADVTHPIASIFNSTSMLWVGCQGGNLEQYDGPIIYADYRDTLLNDGSGIIARFRLTDVEGDHRYILQPGITNMLDKDTSDLIGGIGRHNTPTGCTIERNNADLGEWCLKVLVNGTSGNAISRVTAASNLGLPCKGGTDYSFSAKFRAGTVGRSCRLTIVWYDATGTAVPSSTVNGTPVTDSVGSWSEAILSTVSPESARYANFRILIDVPSMPTENHYIKDFGMWEDSSVPVWSHGGIYHWQLFRATTAIHRLNLVERDTIVFDGSNDFMSALNHSDFDFTLTDDMVAVLIFRSHETTSQGLFGKTNQWTTPSGLGWGVMNVNQFIRFFANDGSGATDTADILTTRWHKLISNFNFLVLRNDPNAVGDNMEILANNISEGSNSSFNAASSSEDLAIGRLGAGPPTYIYGHLEFFAAAISRKKLSSGDLNLLEQELLV